MLILIVALFMTMGIGMARASLGIQNVSDYSVQFDVANPSTGINSSFTIDIYSGWAELGASQFKKIITEGAWKGARFFRVVPGEMHGKKRAQKTFPEHIPCICIKHLHQRPFMLKSLSLSLSSPSIVKVLLCNGVFLEIL